MLTGLGCSLWSTCVLARAEWSDCLTYMEIGSLDFPLYSSLAGTCYMAKGFLEVKEASPDTQAHLKSMLK